MSWLTWFSPRRRRPDVDVVFYTRAGCHLCDKAWAELRRWQRRHDFRLRAVDIDTSGLLVQRFGHWVPVIEVDGKVRLRGHFNPLLFRRLLDAAPQDPTPGELS